MHEGVEEQVLLRDPRVVRGSEVLLWIKLKTEWQRLVAQIVFAELLLFPRVCSWRMSVIDLSGVSGTQGFLQPVAKVR